MLNYTYGTEAVAVGSYNYAGGHYSLALGSNNKTNDGEDHREYSNYKIAIGSFNKAFGEHALAIGTGVIYQDPQDSKNTDITRNLAIGESANAIGFLNKAEGKSSIAFGSGSYTDVENYAYNQAIGNYSIAMGYCNRVGDKNKSIDYSNAIGFKNTISEEHSNAFGSENTIERKNSLAIGYNNSVLGTDTVSSPDYADSNLLGTTDDTSLSGTTVTDNAKYETGAISIGYDNKIYGNRSIALGIDSQAGTENGEGYNIAIGSFARALSDNGIAMGRNAATNGPAAMAIGMEAKAKNGYYGMALGANSFVDIDGAIAIGGISKATGKNSVAIGYRSQATEENTVSFGYTDKNGTLTRRLTNLTAGTGDNDATTVKQVKDAISSATGSIEVIQGGEKKSLQGAVTSIDNIIGDGQLTVDDADGKTVTDLTSVANAINAKAETNAKNMGTISELNKDLQNGDKTNLVSAINKAYEKGSDASKSIGALTDLDTTKKDTLVSAINEVKGSADAAKIRADMNAKNIGTMSDLDAGLKKDGGDITLVEAINNAYNAAKTESDQSIKEVDQKIEKTPKILEA